MKYVVFLGDGMADYPVKELNNKTPLGVANKPFIDGLVPYSEIGIFTSVPDSLKPGSDVANLSVLGYNPEKCYSGRSPLEASSIGIELDDTCVTFRANLVTLSSEENYQDKIMIDYSAGEISTKEAKILIDYLKKEFTKGNDALYSGISYRHCFVVKDGSLDVQLTPPHDITGKPIKEYLPKGKEGERLLTIMKRSEQLLKDHPVNLKRIKQGKNPATSLWFWGEGTKPALQNFYEKTGKKGGMISAVDLLKGIGGLTGMKVIEVKGATGNYDTDFKGKAKACLKNLKKGLDFVYIHMEAPDECGHHGDLVHKIYSIEQISETVVKTVVLALKKSKEDFRILICPDHPTPVSKMTHTIDPIPYMIYDSRNVYRSNAVKYDEENAEKFGLKISSGEELMQRFLGKQI